MLWHSDYQSKASLRSTAILYAMQESLPVKRCRLSKMPQLKVLPLIPASGAALSTRNTTLDAACGNEYRRMPSPTNFRQPGTFTYNSIFRRSRVVKPFSLLLPVGVNIIVLRCTIKLGERMVNEAIKRSIR